MEINDKMSVDDALIQLRSLRSEYLNKASAMDVAVKQLEGLYAGKLKELDTLKAEIAAKEVVAETPILEVNETVIP